MTTTLLLKEIKTLKQRVAQLEQYQQIKPKSGLEQAYGLWKNHPRTKQDLTVVRKRLWKE